MSATQLNRLAMVLAFAGIFIAGYLSLAAAMKGEVPCGPSGGGCSEIASHPSSKWFNYPVAYFGLGAYLVLAFLAGMRSSNGVGKSRGAILAGTLVSGVGTAISGYLTYVALFQIKATCVWCLASALIMTGCFVVHVLMLRAADVEDPKASDLDFKLMIGLGLASTVALVGGSMFIKTGKKTIEFVRQDELNELPIEELVPQDAHILGDPNAPITIVEFADMTCLTCRTTYPKVEQLIKGSAGRYRLVFRHLPLRSVDHKLAWPAAMMAEMAGEKGRFFDFVGGVYATGEEPTADQLWELSVSLGMKRDEIQARISSKNPHDAAIKTIERDINTARKFLKQDATPTFVIFKGSGRRYVPNGFEDMRTTLSLPEFQ